MKKDNPIIEKIEISSERLVEFQEKLKPTPKSPIQISRKAKEALAKQYFGSCLICAGIPTKKIIYDAGAGAKVVERYCQSCFEKQELTDNNNKIKLLDTGQRNKTVAVRMDE